MKAQLFGKHIRGFSTLEILIAFAVLMVSLLALIMVVFGNQSLAIDTQTNVEALSRAQAELEAARATSRADFISVQSSATTTDDIYKKSITVVDIDPSTKQVTSYVSWPEGGRELYVKLSTILTDWFNPTGKCSPVISGWEEPQKLGDFDFPSSEGATGVHVRGTKVYLTSDPRSAIRDDFFIVDASDPTLKPLPKWSSFSTSYGLTDVVVAGTHAFVTADSQEFEVLVIDILDYAHLDVSKIEKKLSLTAPGDDATGKTLEYADEKLYVGLTKSDGPEFRIFDVSTPTLPVEIGPGYEVGAGVNQIVLKDDIAYVATASTTQLIALDVSNPANPHPVDTYFSAAFTGQSIALDPNNSMIYFGRTEGSGNPKFLGFNADDFSAPEWSVAGTGSVFTMTLRSNLLFLTTGDTNDGFQIWKIVNPISPPTRYETNRLDIQQGSTAGADCAGSLLYIGQRSNGALQIVGPS